MWLSSPRHGGRFDDASIGIGEGVRVVSYREFLTRVRISVCCVYYEWVETIGVSPDDIRPPLFFRGTDFMGGLSPEKAKYDLRVTQEGA